MKVTDSETKCSKQPKSGYTSKGSAEHENMMIEYDSLKITNLSSIKLPSIY